MQNLPSHYLSRLDGFRKKAIRFGIVVVFLWIGGLKFFHYEAEALRTFEPNNSLISVVYDHTAKFKMHGNEERELIIVDRQRNNEEKMYGLAFWLGCVPLILAIIIVLYKIVPLPSVIASILVFIMTLGTVSFLIATMEGRVPHFTEFDWGLPFYLGETGY